MFGQAVREFGTVDILVNNAGIQRDAAFDKMTLEDWQKVIDVNLTGTFLCSREAACEFKRRGIQPEKSLSAGKIIFISSVHQVIPWAHHCNYAASKGGINLLMESMAQELAPDRIRVNSIAPGAIRLLSTGNHGKPLRRPNHSSSSSPGAASEIRWMSELRQSGLHLTNPTMSTAPPCS